MTAVNPFVNACYLDPVNGPTVVIMQVAVTMSWSKWFSQLLGEAARCPSQRVRAGRRTTLTAIAAEAGVSLPTVSKVVNGRPDVAPATRARVERLLDEHHYSRSGTRRHRRSGLIDLVFNGLDSPWAVEILRGVEEWGAVHETGVAVSSVRHGNARPASWTSTLASHDTDGVILVTSELTDAQLGQLRSAGIPLVVVDPVNPPPADLPSVGATNWAGGPGRHRAPARPGPPPDRRHRRAR